MSDSELSDPSPDEATIETELRNIVKTIYKSGNLEELTVKRVRISAEKNLGLQDGFLKEAQWKEKSKAIIENQATQQDDTTANSAKTPPKTKAKPPSDPAKTLKRSAAENDSKASAEKRQKKDGTVEKAPPAERKRLSKAKKPKSETSGSELSAPESNISVPDAKTVEATPSKDKEASVVADQSESEMSELIDDAPKPRRKKGAAGGGDKKEAKKAKQKQKKEPPQDSDPDAMEIKKLQGWLTKCGIRKMWWKELKPYETSKAKIKHLKEMLSDVGMAGRYSAEKAEQIREARELQADLEAVQEGEKHWGKAEDEEDEDVDVAKPKRRLARGLQNLDFLDDGEGEETD